MRALVAFALVVSASLAVGAELAQPVDPAATDAPASQFRYGARVDLKAFTHRRDIAAPSGGVVELHLDAAALAHSAPGFADLRVVSGDGRQVPYLVTKQDQPLAIRLPGVEKEESNGDRRSRGANANVSRYLIRLPYSVLPAAQLVLRTPARLFSREVRLEVRPSHERGADEIRIVGRTHWSHTDPDTDAPQMAFDVSSLHSAELHLVVDEGDNAPLPLDPPSLLLPAYRLRFARPPGVALQLVYGNRLLDAPRYDVALLPQSLLDAPAAEATVAPERPAPAPRVPAGILFWVALALAVLVLGGLVARLLRSTAE